MRACWSILASVLFAGPVAAQVKIDKPLSADDCVAMALAHNATLKGAEAELDELRAQGDQVSALMSPSLTAVTYAAPMFGAKGGIGLPQSYQRDLSTWGPYVHGDAQVVLPLSTFGRFTSAKKATEGRVGIGKERVRERQHAVRAEVRRLYHLRLYALSMIPNLENGQEILKSAIEQADRMFEEGTGTVTVSDKMKLSYGAGEIDRFLRMARDGVVLATLALNHAMGLDLDTPIAYADAMLTLPAEPPPALAALLEKARASRPELAQIEHGKKATQAWQDAESKAYLPTLFAAAAGRGDWSPVRPTGFSAVGFNAFNDWFVGAALGLQFDFQPARADAKAREAAAKGRWVVAQEALARTGIPLQVRKAYLDITQHRDLSEVAENQVKATRKWMSFSAAGYKSGTAEAKDVLEGVAAYLLSKKNYYDHLLGVWQGVADLEQFTGSEIGH